MSCSNSEGAAEKNVSVPYACSGQTAPRSEGIRLDRYSPTERDGVLFAIPVSVGRRVRLRWTAAGNRAEESRADGTLHPGCLSQREGRRGRPIPDSDILPTPRPVLPGPPDSRLRPIHGTRRDSSGLRDRSISRPGQCRVLELPRVASRERSDGLLGEQGKKHLVLEPAHFCHRVVDIPFVTRQRLRREDIAIHEETWGLRLTGPGAA